MITVYGRADSTNVQKVVWLFAELGLPFERINKGGAFGGLDDPAYRAMNPNGRIPTVVDGARTLWESNAILRHYARLHPGAGLFPTAIDEMVRADMLLDWNTTVFWDTLRPAYFGLRRFGKSCDDPAVVAALNATEPVLQTLDGLLDGRTFAAGDTFTIADMPIAISADRWLGLQRSLAPYPHVERWHRGIAAREAYGAHVFS